MEIDRRVIILGEQYVWSYDVDRNELVVQRKSKTGDLGATGVCVAYDYDDNEWYVPAFPAGCGFLTPDDAVDYVETELEYCRQDLIYIGEPICPMKRAFGAEFCAKHAELDRFQNNLEAEDDKPELRKFKDDWYD